MNCRADFRAPLHVHADCALPSDIQFLGLEWRRITRRLLHIAVETVDVRAAVPVRLALSIYMCSRHLKKKQVLFLEKIFLRGSFARSGRIRRRTSAPRKSVFVSSETHRFERKNDPTHGRDREVFRFERSPCCRNRRSCDAGDDKVHECDRRNEYAVSNPPNPNIYGTVCTDSD